MRFAAWDAGLYLAIELYGTACVIDVGTFATCAEVEIPDDDVPTFLKLLAEKQRV